MLMVVALHASGLWLGGDVTSVNWRIANAVNSACRPAVPFFFMMTGYLLYRSVPLPFATYLRKRLWRIVPSFLFFTGFALAYRVGLGEHLGVDAAWQWLIVPSFYHLWFFYAIAFVYVGVWFLRPTKVTPAVGALGCFGLLCYLGWRGESYAAYLLYAVAGYYLGVAQLSGRAAMLTMAIGTVSLAWICVETISVSMMVGHLDQRWYEYASLPVVIASFALFYAARYYMRTVSHLVMERAAAASLFVYCGHPFIIDALARWCHLPDYLDAAPGILFLTIFCSTALTGVYWCYPHD